jgi:hypothetical protein
MATLAANVLGLSDYAKRLKPDGKIDTIVEMLSQTNEIVNDMHWQMGNLETGHRYSVRTALPSVYWRKLNEGTTPSKSVVQQVTEGCATLDAWSEVDKELADLGGDPDGFRVTEARAFIEAMSQEFASKVFSGNAATTPEEFDGLNKRYASSSGNSADNVILGGGSGADNSSIWLIVWGPNTVHGFYPKGSKAGLEHRNHGEGIVETTAGIAGTRMVAYRDQFIWKCGLAVRDWRAAARICNIDISALVAQSSAADLFTLMKKAYHRIHNLNAGRAVWYMNRTVFQELDIQADRGNISTSGGGIYYQNIEGRIQSVFRGIPVHVCDALPEDESLVS